MRVGIIFPSEEKQHDIKDWLASYSANNQIVSFTTLRQAVPIINKAPCDLLISADRFEEAQGKSLLKGLRRMCPAAQIILLATHPDPIHNLWSETRDLNTYYFTQPWDMQSLLAHIEAAIGAETPSFTIAMSLDETQSQRISEILESLQKETGAMSIYLVTNLGQVLDYKGSELAQIGEISSLLGGSFAALNQLSYTFGESVSADNLIHQQGPGEDVYALSIGDSALLVLRFLHSTSTPRIGMVSFYARRAVGKLAHILAESNKELTQPVIDEDVKETLDAELDQLFGSETTPNQPTIAKSVSPLLSYTQALRHGLVTMGLEGRFEAAHSRKSTKPQKDSSEEEKA